MSISRLSAGAGYRYLTRHTAAGDARPGPGQSLTAYYTATGLPPGRWTGAGLPGIGAGDGSGLRPGAVVTEEAIGRLFGTGRNPVTDEPLGLAYPRFKTVAERITERVGRLPADLTDPERTAAVAAIEAQEQAKPQRSAVAGFDFTFTVPKSVSVLWALADPELAHAVEQAHHDAVDAVLQVVEERFLHTRTGAGSKIRVPAQGAIAAAFDHWDTRAGDPNLHTHLVIANKVQGPDGKWRAVDGQVLFAAAVACSEIYDSVLADLLHARLGVRFGYRDRGPRRTPAFEIAGIPDALIAAFSSRSQAIGAHTQALVAAFTETHGREPDRVEVLRLRQQATLATRPDKHLTPLPELRARWRATAEAVTGRPVDTMLDTAIAPAIHTAVSPRVAGGVDRPLTSANNPWASGRASGVTGWATGTTGRARIRSTGAADDPGVPERLLDRYADATIAAVAARRATWTGTNVLAEAARVTRALRLPDPAARMTVLDRVVAAALERCVALDPPANAAGLHRDTNPASPALTSSSDITAIGTVVGAGGGTGVGRRADAPEPAYTTWEILAAEARLLAAHTEFSAPVADPRPIKVASARKMPGVPGLSADQARAAATIATSGRRVEVLVGPAGTGKTHALFALRAAWELTHGSGTVIALAPSATAALALGASLHVGADTLAKWAHETRRDDHASGPHQTYWRLQAGQLVIVDEAAMAATTDLDLLITHAGRAGAKVVLVGDPLQLGAVETGGAFALLVEQGHAVELEQLHRFSQDWEAAATRRLRLGDPACLDTYTAHGRLHDGPTEAMLEKAYRAWASDTAAGRHSLLLAPDRDTVTALNARARADRIRAGAVDPRSQVALHDATSAGVGDEIVTRRNNRRLTKPNGEWVRNGDRWHVHAAHPDGSLDASPITGAVDRSDGIPFGAVRLPADYVRDHVELGYAATIHRAQGATADTAHVITGPGISREAFYVGMTRGRHANHAYLATDTTSGEWHHTDPTAPVTGRQIAAGILARTCAPVAATTELQRRYAEHLLALDRADRTAPGAIGPPPPRRYPRLTPPPPSLGHEAPGR
ncbi:MobF family relaxase [Sporichthya polymorpha]|uniref:MobF family relaxase n=1 Tax=Sporichthya polymorpha TaxID=35751 RepID=UPI0003701266|nr:MobF family relaxase [Sporichthya polymorpha]